jgi:hypothetical protein
LLNPPTPSGAVPANLVVGGISDPLEREADHVADQVMRMPDSDLSIASASPQLESKGHSDDEMGYRQLKTKPVGRPVAAGREAPGVVHEVLRSPGQPLDFANRSFFEPRFGQDLSHVRIHADSRAVESARSVNALAYTVGHDVVFGFSGTVDRKHLLAHELVHVLQQSGIQGNATFLQRQGTGEPVRAEEGESLPGGPGMERTVPEGTKQPTPPGSPDAVRAEAESIGAQWGMALADKDIQLDILQNKIGGLRSVWDTLTPEQKKAHAQRIEDEFARLPLPPHYDKPELISAQDDGFMAGVESGYSLEKLKNFFVKVGTELAIFIFSGLAARGVKLPRSFANLLQRLLPRVVAPGTGAAFGQQMAEEMMQSGFRGNPFREFIARLNAAPVRLPPNEAAEAIRVGTKVVSGGTMGTMPPIQQGEILVVPSRAPIPNAPVMGIRPDGTVIMGRAPKIDIITADASGAPIFPPIARITGDIQWE